MLVLVSRHSAPDKSEMKALMASCSIGSNLIQAYAHKYSYKREKYRGFVAGSVGKKLQALNDVGILVGGHTIIIQRDLALSRRIHFIKDFFY